MIRLNLQEVVGSISIQDVINRARHTLDRTLDRRWVLLPDEFAQPIRTQTRLRVLPTGPSIFRRLPPGSQTLVEARDLPPLTPQQTTIIREPVTAERQR